MLESQVLEIFTAAQQDMRDGCWADATAKLEWLARVSPIVPPAITAATRAAPSATALVRNHPACNSPPLGRARRLRSPATGAWPSRGPDSHPTCQSALDERTSGTGDPVMLALVALVSMMLISFAAVVLVGLELAVLRAIAGALE